MQVTEELKKDIDTYDAFMADSPLDGPKQKLNDFIEMSKLCATTKLEFKYCKNLFECDDLKKAQDAIASSENKYNRYKLFSRAKEVHPSLLKLRDEAMAQKQPPAKRAKQTR